MAKEVSLATNEYTFPYTTLTWFRFWSECSPVCLLNHWADKWIHKAFGAQFNGHLLLMESAVEGPLHQCCRCSDVVHSGAHQWCTQALLEEEHRRQRGKVKGSFGVGIREHVDRGVINPVVVMHTGSYLPFLARPTPYPYLDLCHLYSWHRSYEAHRLSQCPPRDMGTLFSLTSCRLPDA